MTRTPFSITRLLALAVVAVLAALPARAGDLADARATLAKSAAVVEKVRQDTNFVENFDPLLAEARAVLVVPSFYRGAFFVGGAYGNGTLVVRNDAGEFSPPLFMRLIGGSLGLQFGGQEAQLIFLIMTRQGLDAILKDQFKVGANVGISVGTFGANVEAATTSNMNKDIIVFGHSRGAFGGGGLEGASIESRADWNQAVYGPNATAKAVLFDRRWRLDEAEPLFSALKTVPVQPLAGPAATMQDHNQGQSQDMPAMTAQPTQPVQIAPMAAEPSYSASGQTTGSGAAPSTAPAQPAQPSAGQGNAPVRLMPVDRQDLQ